MQDEAFIQAQRARVMGAGPQEIRRQRGTYDEALRNSSRVEEAAPAPK